MKNKNRKIERWNEASAGQQQKNTNNNNNISLRKPIVNFYLYAVLLIVNFCVNKSNLFMPFYTNHLPLIGFDVVRWEKEKKIESLRGGGSESEIEREIEWD